MWIFHGCRRVQVARCPIIKVIRKGLVPVMHIRSERDAIEFLFNCWRDPEFGNDKPLTLERCALRIRLEPGNGKADRRMRRAVDLHQRHINLTYLLAKNGTLSGRLSAHDQDILSIAFSVEKGSTIGESDFSNPLKLIHKVMRAAKASGRHELIETPWVAEVLPWQHAPDSSWGAEAKPLHSAPGAMRLGLTDA